MLSPRLQNQFFVFRSLPTSREDGKIVIAGTFYEGTPGSFIVSYNPNGTLDSSFSANVKELTSFGNGSVSARIQTDGKIVVCNSSDNFENQLSVIARYNTNGTLDSSFTDDGLIQTSDLRARRILFDNNKLYAVGSAYDGPFGGGTFGAVARYLIDGNENKPRNVKLSIPFNVVKYTAPARIKLNATATDEDGKITKVRFYNGTTLLHTETVSPYGFLWIDVPVGVYSFTAKAFDDSGNVTTSNSIKVSVVDTNVAPVVNIIRPVDDTTYTGPATIRIVANAKDPNERISKVEFYNGTTLIRTENYYPYAYTWTNVKPGTYTITAKAYDEKGLSTISDPVTVTVESHVTVNITPDKDNTIYSTSPESSNGLGALILTGRQGADAGYTILRSLLHFNLSSIPAGSKIDSVKLFLQIDRVAWADPGVSLHKLKVNWGEGTSGGPGSTTGSPQRGYPATKGDATWSHAFYPDFRWTTPGGDFEDNSSSTGDAGRGTFVMTNLSADVQSWVNDSSTNFGWILKGTDDSITYNAKLIYSRHVSEETYRPTLSITYTPKENLPTVSLADSTTVSNRPSSVSNKTDLNGAPGLRLSPNPARSTLQIFANGLQLNKPATISVISASGIIMKTIQVNTSNKVVQLDISSLASGVYAIKVISGDKVMYKQFVKL